MKTAEEVYIAQLKHSHDQLEIVRHQCELRLLEIPRSDSVSHIKSQIERIDKRIDDILGRLQEFTKGRI